MENNEKNNFVESRKMSDEIEWIEEVCTNNEPENEKKSDEIVEKKKEEDIKNFEDNNKILSETDFKYFKCRFCGLTYNYSSTLKAHERIHNVTMPYSCPKCDESFHYMCELEYHIKQHENQKGYKCDCGRTFHNYTDMLYHKHDGDDYYLENPGALNSFKQYNSNQGEINDYVSKITSSTYSNPKSGEMVVEGLPSIKMPVPSFMVDGFEPKHPLKQYSETRSCPYICQYCSKAYSDSRSLTYHMYSHRGERYFNPRASRFLMSRTD
ncbi:Zinc finger, C2H2 domain and Zinc finger C2H2-type/integrase DNA-binding domain and Zinc finger,C2H2-like domain-containing protein [Strongyloides ratti]|uniref:Zinc finger protein unc-98 n=1 Tax=Strongyloides ratti TaxID=34506 RepID=A0A090KVQ9_STRRB|nr:Zinc finger, C2H2 domain and Zinc finger C2H2-type/integrase DNA-binding domain and Zinc finger,C2H2-like domain-containing protein [Strongyloides ratti]CEF59332.1 Zinc finger, C2H2 domain and Zinc finger C2H2-type/integrase DNA-binding domain and Zinc finger,C2H2-like domain-containing protein [Strongyloides ratti]